MICARGDWSEISAERADHDNGERAHRRLFASPRARKTSSRQAWKGRATAQGSVNWKGRAESVLKDGGKEGKGTRRVGDSCDFIVRDEKKGENEESSRPGLLVFASGQTESEKKVGWNFWEPTTFFFSSVGIWCFALGGESERGEIAKARQALSLSGAVSQHKRETAKKGRKKPSEIGRLGAENGRAKGKERSKEERSKAVGPKGATQDRRPLITSAWDVGMEIDQAASFDCFVRRKNDCAVQIHCHDAC